jgi:hypothetical protein
MGAKPKQRDCLAVTGRVTGRVMGHVANGGRAERGGEHGWVGGRP